MELSTFLNKLTKPNINQVREYFWAIQIWDNSVKSAIWSVEEGHTRVVALGSQINWQQTVDRLVDAVDESLSVCLDKFSQTEKGEPSKVIFGLPADWLTDEKINSTQQHLLQSLCSKLDLHPLGFVLTIDAINRHLKNVEGAPSTVIFVNPQEDKVLVSLVSLGKVLGVEMVRASGNLGADVYEGILRFEQEVLPSRILLFDGQSTEKARQAIMDFPWQQKLPFLHFPKVEILPPDFDITAICLAGGGEIAVSLGLMTEEAKVADGAKEEDYKAGRDEVIEVVDNGGQNERLDFGFVRGKDVKTIETQPEVILEKREDIASTNHLEIKSSLELDTGEVTGIKKQPFRFPSLLTPPKISKKFLLMPFILFLVLFFLGVSVFWLLLKTNVMVYLSPRSVVKELEVKVDPNREVIDFSTLTLPGKTIETEANSKQGTRVTGKKVVGEKSKGTVTIFNTGGSKNLLAGTSLTGPGGLNFSLDQNTSVGSGSAVAREEVKTNITASNIGAEYNLAADSTFTVGSLDKSTIGAVNETALSGGTSRQISAVAEGDQKKLLADLTADLETKAKSDLSNKISGVRKLVEGSVSLKETRREFDHKVGDEVNDLNLSLWVKATGITFSEDELLLVLKKQISDAISEGYELKQESIQSQSEVKKVEKDGTVILQARFTAETLPKIDKGAIINNIKGMSTKAAREYLSKLPGYVDAEFQVKPSVLSDFPFLPKKLENITIVIKSK